MQKARSIGLCMFQYSVDHDGKYPDGKSSTEVFQKLIDAKYLIDPAILFLPFPGKAKGAEGHPLKPENVCWDVTGSIDQSDPDQLPMVFMTGYKVAYVPGGSAIPLLKFYPLFRSEPRTWLQWWHGEPLKTSYSEPLGIPVCYKGNNAKFCRLTPSANSDGAVLNFVPASFDPKGKTYRQLTPDGPLP